MGMYISPLHGNGNGLSEVGRNGNRNVVIPEIFRLIVLVRVGYFVGIFELSWPDILSGECLDLNRSSTCSALS